MDDRSGFFDSAGWDRFDPRWPNWLAVRRLRSELPSTQDEAKSLLAQGNRPPLIVQALRQTAGRGRGGNRWSAEEGALAFTLVFDPATLGLAPQRLPTLAIATALALCESFQRFSPQPLGIKWPNDVCVAGRKLAGILIETQPTPGSADPIVLVGVGANLNNSFSEDDEALRASAVSLSDLTDKSVDSSNGFGNVLADLLPKLEREYRAAARGDAEQVARWNARNVLADRRCTIRVPGANAPLVGVAGALDADGALTLATEQGTTTVRSGSVVERER